MTCEAMTKQEVRAVLNHLNSHHMTDWERKFMQKMLEQDFPITEGQASMVIAVERALDRLI